MALIRGFLEREERPCHPSLSSRCKGRLQTDPPKCCKPELDSVRACVRIRVETFVVVTNNIPIRDYLAFFILGNL